jgi:hypothetical protein
MADEGHNNGIKFFTVVQGVFRGRGWARVGICPPSTPPNLPLHILTSILLNAHFLM